MEDAMTIEEILKRHANQIIVATTCSYPYPPPYADKFTEQALTDIEKVIGDRIKELGRTVIICPKCKMQVYDWSTHLCINIPTGKVNNEEH